MKELRGKPRGQCVSAILESKPLNRCSSEVRRKKSREPFIQDGPCSELTPKLIKCRECKIAPATGLQQRPSTANTLSNNIFCRFYAFRKLCYSAKGLIAVSGFCKPSDADADDVELWLPIVSSANGLNIETAKYLISLLSTSVSQLIQDEKQALELGKSRGGKVVWKRAIQGVREMCDVCDATLFNVHWTCAKCGFAVCSNCYQLRTSNSTTTSSSTSSSTTCSTSTGNSTISTNSSTSSSSKVDGPGDSWLTCSANKQRHEPESLMTTQIVPSDVLPVVGRMLSDVMTKWHLTSPANSLSSPVATGLRSTGHNRLAKMRRGKQQSEVEPSQSSSSSSSSSSSAGSSTGSGGGSAGRPGSRAGSDKPLSSCNGTNSDGAAPTVLQLCQSKLSTSDIELFRSHWLTASPVLVTNTDTTCYRPHLWRPSNLSHCGGFPGIDISTGTEIPATKFWDYFEHRKNLSSASTLRQKEWPGPEEFALFSGHIQDLDAGLPLEQYTLPTGALHPMSYLPEYFVRPELSMLRVYGCRPNLPMSTLSFIHHEPTDLISAAVYAADGTDQDDGVLESLGVTKSSKTARHSRLVVAVWHVYLPEHSTTIRQFISQMDGRHGDNVAEARDSLVGGTVYLNSKMRSQLNSEHHINCTTIVQHLGDTVFIPALAPFQVSAAVNCVLACREFLSPETLLRAKNQLSVDPSVKPPAAFYDQLQGKNLIFHVVKGAIATLQSASP